MCLSSLLNTLADNLVLISKQIVIPGTEVEPTWHLERTSRVWAGRRMRVGAAAASRRVWVAAVGGVGERVTIGLLKRVRESRIVRHVGLVLSQVAELGQEAVLRVVLAVPGNQHRRKDWKGEKEGKSHSVRDSVLKHQATQGKKTKTKHILPPLGQIHICLKNKAVKSQSACLSKNSFPCLWLLHSLNSQPSW